MNTVLEPSIFWHKACKVKCPRSISIALFVWTREADKETETNIAVFHRWVEISKCVWIWIIGEFGVVCIFICSTRHVSKFCVTKNGDNDYIRDWAHEKEIKALAYLIEGSNEDDEEKRCKNSIDWAILELSKMRWGEHANHDDVRPPIRKTLFAWMIRWRSPLSSCICLHWI